MTATEIGALMNITPRRVRQFVEDGLLPTLERGKFDFAFLLWLRKGQERAAKVRNRPDRDTLVALGWLGGVDDKPSEQDLAAFPSLFERNRLPRDAALLAVGRAMQLVAR